MVLEVCRADVMLRFPCKRANGNATQPVDDDKVIHDDDRTSVQQHVVIRAEAQDVVRHIVTIVGTSQRTDVCALGVGAAGRIKRDFAHLASIPVQFLRLLCHESVPHDALDCLMATRPFFRDPPQRSPGRRGGIIAHEPEPPDSMARATNFRPKAFHVIKTVIPKPTGRPQSGGFPPAPDHTNRQSVNTASGEREVSTPQFLTCNLLSSIRIVPAVSGVDDGIALVFVVLVPTVQDNRVTPFQHGPGYAGHARTMNAGDSESGAIFVGAADRHTGHLTELAWLRYLPRHDGQDRFDYVRLPMCRSAIVIASSSESARSRGRTERADAIS
jgi:hypothetical protein